ncbi:MAG TPA: hypothetical protein VL463_34800 [Kofleriaceae bacterium]|nr:hypothetical protein [Kofleriaceae bacterium]
MRILAALLVSAACGKEHVLTDACVTKEVTLQVTTPIMYFCHTPFTAKLDVTNGSCAQIQVQSIAVTGVVTAGTCGAPGPGNYPPLVQFIDPGATVTVLDLHGGEYCCGAPGCPAQFECDERYTFEVSTSAGSLMQSQDVHLDLGGCSSVCP